MSLTADGVLQAAATMVNAIMGGGPSGITIPATGSTFDAVTIQRNLYAQELLKVWVNDFKNILGDPTDWPLPGGAATETPLSLANELLKKIGTTNPAVTALIQQVITAMGTAAAPAVNPGVPVTSGS